MTVRLQIPATLEEANRVQSGWTPWLRLGGDAAGQYPQWARRRWELRVYNARPGLVVKGAGGLRTVLWDLHGEVGRDEPQELDVYALAEPSRERDWQWRSWDDEQRALRYLGAYLVVDFWDFRTLRYPLYVAREYVGRWPDLTPPAEYRRPLDLAAVSAHARQRRLTVY